MMASSKGRDNSFVAGKDVARMDVAECNAYIAQLKSVIDAAATETPPPGVDTAEVERRLMLLQAALEEVERRNEDLRHQKEIEQNERYLKTLNNRLEAEREAESKRVFVDKKRDALVRENRDLQVAYFKDRNARVEEKQAQCKEFNFSQQVETMSKAGSNEGRRERNLKNLEAERRRKCKELHDKMKSRQDYAREVNRKKEAQLEDERKEKEMEAALHEEEIQLKLAEIRLSRQSKWKKKKEASRAKSRVVWENGQALLETDLKDHEMLIEELDAKIKGQQQRYAVEQAQRDYYVQQRAQYRESMKEKQEENLFKIIDGRLKKGEEVIKASDEKKAKGEKAKEEQATRYVKQGEALRKDLAKHQKVALDLERQRNRDTLDKNYKRWNIRAARIIGELNEALDRDNAASASAKHFQGSNRSYASSTTTSLPSIDQPLQLPTPADFNV